MAEEIYTEQTAKNGAVKAKKRGGIFDIFYNDIAIDLGTANTLIFSKREGIVLREPSIVAFNMKGVPVSIGMEAWRMHEKSHNGVRTVRPLRNGVIADFEAAEHMISGMIKSVKQRWYSTTRTIVICVPSGITPVEREAVRDSARYTGAKKVFLVEEPMAAAIGAAIDVHQPNGQMIVDIGGGTTEIAVISFSGVVHAESVRLAGDRLSDDIINYYRRHHNLLIGERTAERIKCEIGSAAPLDEELTLNIKGRDMVKGIPKNLLATSSDVREAIGSSVNLIVESILKSLEKTPPELAADIVDNGITLAGGGALLKGLAQRITELSELPVQTADDPLTAVIRGTGAVLDDLEYYLPVVS